MNLLEFSRRTWKTFSVLAVVLGFVVDISSSRSVIGEAFPIISPFLPLIGIAVSSFLVSWILFQAMRWYLENRPSAKFGRLKQKIDGWRGTFRMYKIDLISFDVRTNPSIHARMQECLIEIEYELDRLGITYPNKQFNSVEGADEWIHFLSQLIVFCEHRDLRNARSCFGEV